MSFLNRAAQISKIQQKEQLAVRTFFPLFFPSLVSYPSLSKTTVCKLLKTTNL